MNNNNPILFGSDGWYDALTGERINPQRLGKIVESKLNAAMVGIGANKSWEEAHNQAVQVVYALTRQMEAMKAIVQRHLQEVIDDQNTVKRMNNIRIGDKSHEKYQPEIDLLSSILREIDQLGQGCDHDT